MSVMIINDRIYSKVASSINFMLDNNKVHCYPYNYKIAPIVRRKMVNHEIAQLRQQNYISYDERYNDDSQIDEMVFHDEMPLPPIQLYKYLQAILYNIETNYTSPFIDKFMKGLANKIINDLPEYQSAQWA